MSFASGMFATENGWSFRVNVYAETRKAGGTGPCTISSPANWTPKLLRTVDVPIDAHVADALGNGENPTRKALLQQWVAGRTHRRSRPHRAELLATVRIRP